MRDVMIDLETLGTGPSAAIIAVGAVVFDPETGELGETFYHVVDLASSMGEGGVVDAAPVLWWLGQSDEARKALTEADTLPIEDVLLDFDDYIQTFADGTDKVRVWGNGASFDNVILSTAYARLHMPQPWKFWNDRCYRTVKSMFPHIKMERSGTHHNALDDAISQAKHLCAMLKPPRDDDEVMALPLSNDHPFGCSCKSCQERVR